ncbi:FAD-dependent oxidoreductase [Streptomyces pini]|uniref:Thioredoxin reductase (NADPH)/alkyl hydroperoxide reductase subunit F n=1 Tax=Streptomyces pini TaxID=1520580 RepID=A0A1I4IX32_9ACTN|nr:FAD-dependent oxidoreductase [Streptomyces pini]SFL58830.1 thioredoxin reductase (NADPH)/alkyl hydroperoxide reductase subunit F [Streptomyces pini]
MADTSPPSPSPFRAGSSATRDTDLIVVGGGPAGCAAARMAAGVGMRSVLVEPDRLCRNLYRIPALNNVLGGHASGPGLAEAITAELKDTRLCRLELGRYVTELRADADRVTATLDTGARLTAPYAVVATGTGPLQPRDAAWITAPGGLTLPPLWQAGEADAEGRTLLVLGGDRPIGTFLRAHPATGTRLLVAYPAADDYKVEEIREDPRVTLLPVGHLTLEPGEGAAVSAEVVGRGGERRAVVADAVYLGIGNAPAAPPGDLVRGADGYCPPAGQHPRVVVAGDLRSARFQRIMTALGSGSEAALHAYYATREPLTES